MPLQIMLSQVKSLPFDFAEAVQEYIAAKKHHQTTEGQPAPGAPHQMVEAAVKRVPGSIDPPRADEFVADYEIVDDTPPAPSLDQRKSALAMDVQQQAQVAIDKIRPPLKARLLAMDFSRAMAIEEAKRTPADKATIASYLDGNARIDAITYHLAKIEAQIHDLTEATIGDWSASPFPK
jgi:hypothetical protein